MRLPDVRASHLAGQIAPDIGPTEILALGSARTEDEIAQSAIATTLFALAASGFPVQKSRAFSGILSQTFKAGHLIGLFFSTRRLNDPERQLPQDAWLPTSNSHARFDDPTSKRVFAMDLEQANRVMLHVHQRGVGV